MAGTGAITTGEFRAHFIPKLMDWLDTNIRSAMDKSEWKRLFKKTKTNLQTMETRQWEAAGVAMRKGEAERHALISIEEGYPKKRAQTEYGAKVQYTKTARRFVRTDLIERNTKALPRSINEFLELLARAYIEYADTALASVPTNGGVPLIDPICGDTLVLAHIAHTFKSDGTNTYKNKTSAHVALSQDGVQNACNDLCLWANNQGQLLNVEPKMLIVPTGLIWKGYELLHSETKSETAERADNALRIKFGRWDMWEYKHMVNQTEWIIETDVENDYLFAFGQEVEKDTDYDPDTGVFSVFADISLAHGVCDPRRYYFNKAA